MIDKNEHQRILLALPFMLNADRSLDEAFKRSVTLNRIPAGSDVFIEGDRVDAIALLISGVVRVYKISESGREITLYRFGRGESCILTANALLSRQKFPAIATVEEDALAVMVPADVFRDWVGRYDLWRTFVFDLLSQRLSSVLEIVEEVAFHRMDKRVAGFLLQHSGSKPQIHFTHQEIAAELGSSREVISRILEGMTSQDLIKIGRGTLEILDMEGLQSLAVL